MGGSDSDSFHLDVSGALDAMNVPSLDKCDQITDVGFIFLVLNAIIGTGVLSFGEKFRNGVILSLIINGLSLALNFGAQWLLFRCVQMTACYSYEEIWHAAYGRRSRIIPATCLLILCFGIVQIFFNLLVSQFGTLINVTLKINNKTTYHNSFFILFLVWLVCVVPFCFVRRMKVLVIPSIVAMVAVLFLLIYIIYLFAGQHRYNNYVFDPAKQMKWVANVDLGKMIQAFLFGYTYAPLVFPSVLTVRPHREGELSFRCVLRNTGIALGISFCLYELFGLLEYFTLFDLNTGASYLSYFRNPSDLWFTGSTGFNIAAGVAGVVLLVMSIPLYLVTGGEIVVSFFAPEVKMPGLVAMITKLVVSLILALLTCATVYVSKVVSIFVDIASTFLCFMFVPLAYFVFKGAEDKKLFGFVVFMGVCSLAILGFVIYYEVHVW